MYDDKIFLPKEKLKKKPFFDYRTFDLIIKH